MGSDPQTTGPGGKARGPHWERRLKASQIKSLPPGRHTDGGGLYLVVAPSGSRRWLLRITVRGRRRDFGLGPASAVSLADARNLAHEYRRIAKLGGDPMSSDLRRDHKTVSFRAAAETVHSTQIKATSRNGKHTDQWLRTIEKYAFPTLGNMSVDAISPGDIVSVLSPIWYEKPETARRVHQRIRAILDWSIATGYRQPPNPASGVRRAFKPQKTEVQHFAAINWMEAPALYRELKQVEGVGAKALRFTMLTVLRSGTVRHATWDEFSEYDTWWRIPKYKMKAGKEFLVPLPEDATRLLQDLRASGASSRSDLVFHSPTDHKKPISENTMAKVLKRFYPDATVHGMRSVFRDWSEIFAESRREVAESVLAHAGYDKVDSSYRRTQYLNEREELMQVWGLWLNDEPGDIDMLRNKVRLARYDLSEDEA